MTRYLLLAALLAVFSAAFFVAKAPRCNDLSAPSIQIGGVLMAGCGR